MQAFGARLEDYTDRAASVAAVFGGVVIFQKAEFLDRLRIGIKHDLVARGPIVDAAIEQVSYGVPAASGHADAPKPFGEPPLLVPYVPMSSAMGMTPGWVRPDLEYCVR